MRIYLGGPMFVQAEVEYNLRLAAKLRELGFEVYCPNETEPINDKTRDDITPRVVYDFDIRELEASNVMICQVSEEPARTGRPATWTACPGTSIPLVTTA